MLKPLICASLLATSIASTLVAQETPNPDTIVILDASNSMWGQINGKSKISIAQDVIADLVDELETGSEFGLMAFGHRRRNDCNDIELILPIGPLDAKQFSAAVAGISPRGRTPLSGAIQEAARVLSTDTRSGRIVLVSDGIESCEADPCALVAELESSGLDFTAHVIGFNVADIADQDQLRCIAKNSDGLYRTAGSTNELKTALTMMMEDDVEKAPDPATSDTAEMAAPLLKSPDTVAPLSQFSVEWGGETGAGDFISIALIGSAPGDFKSAASGAAVTLTAPETLGLYELRYVSKVQDKVLERRNLRVIAQ